MQSRFSNSVFNTVVTETILYDDVRLSIVVEYNHSSCVTLVISRPDGCQYGANLVVLRGKRPSVAIAIARSALKVGSGIVGSALRTTCGAFAGAFVTICGAFTGELGTS